MTISSIQTITIPVADQERALAFYRDVLQFEVRRDAAYGDARWLTVAPVGAETEMVLHLPSRGIPATSQGVVLNTDDVAATCAALREAGVTVDGPTSEGWGPQALFRDPDGNGYVLTQSR